MKHEDRVKRYLISYLDGFVFDALSTGFLKKIGMADLMEGVPVPFRKEDLDRFSAGGGVDAARLADNMSRVIGIDPGFKYAQNYTGFLNRLYGGKACGSMLEKAVDAAEKGEFDEACIFFRGALLAEPDNPDGMYGYAKVCREMYQKSDDPEYTGRFKAESLEYFELLAEARPEFAPPYYYLGYAYLNTGLYIKAGLAWKEFLKRNAAGQEADEIKERLSQIADPVKIERGYNMVLSGRFEKGLNILEPYMDTQYKAWWPLSYYLGVCYKRLGLKEKALASFKNVLALNGSHLETMEELAEIYALDNDAESEEKYRKKIKIIST